MIDREFIDLRGVGSEATMLCPGCGATSPEGKKFCSECGTPLALACAACGSALTGNEKFCGECGAPRALPSAPTVREAPSSERRLVSVLFADLVGFTTLSEARDAEEVRELLSRYFDTCSRLIALYGGTVEKFIGDAVMAVWGTPTATEDDAERAVRAALDLVAAVSALGDELGEPELRARAGVLTGEAAVTIGAEGQGMVAGDLVNTAARVQAVAEPGTVLIGEATRRATEQTVVYEDAGSHELKGKEEPVPLWRALRVVSGARGSLKSQGLEAPFVGRDRELRQIKDLFHACAEGRKAHLVSVTGIAGIGKSRLAWEFYKYFDGLPQLTYWHRGRCLSYGEGVTYWALADMVRMRCRIGEEDEAAVALEKLRVALEEYVPDAGERAFVEPRLAHLLGLAEHTHEKQDLFAAWRLFFERLADVYPTVLAFEDMQWGDASLLDFVEYLLEWSRNSALYVITLARPELADRRPTWGAGHRNFTSLYLEPLPAGAMDELLSGLVPGLPERTRAQILARAEGVPLYAVETVRMLLDRGLIAQEGSVYRPVGEIGELDVPETLHALIAARLDGLSTDERRLLQDGAVLGKMFTRDGLAALSGLAADELEPLLGSLVRKEVLSLQADARSPEHGQYGFLQDLVRHVAYETLSKHERRARHLAAADYLLATFAEEDEIAEVVAAHYLDAHEANPNAADADEVRAKAREALIRAGERAQSLAAAGEAQRYFAQAAALTGDVLGRAELLDRAGWLAYYAADLDTAAALLGESVALYEGEGNTHAAARVSSRLAFVERWQGHFDAAVARMERAFEVLSADKPDEDFAQLVGRLGSAYVFTGDLDRALERIEQAIEIAEALGSSVVLAPAFTARSMISQATGRPHEAFAYLGQALAIALEHDHESLGSIYFNLSDREFHRDRYVDALEYLQSGLEVARRRGSRPSEWGVLAEMTYPLYMVGRWDEALTAFTGIPEDRLQDTVTLSVLSAVTEIHVHRGDPQEARRVLSLYPATSVDVQEESSYVAARAAVLYGEGRFEEALATGVESLAAFQGGLGSKFSYQHAKQGFLHAVEAALALGRREQAEELLAQVDELPGGLRPPYLEAQVLRLRARLEGDAAGFAAAAARFRELGMPFWAAVSELEQSELIGAAGRSESLDEAREIFERLQAAPWLERLAANTPRAPAPA
ncbi:MAG TPA: adenylate/guanylate cyclase domain-containing protein [Gaiellaceae bacterium]|nr:adenylate/guanylate cyclase domain-containing protein [Gaiellaceae bacterium]